MTPSAPRPTAMTLSAISLAAAAVVAGPGCTTDLAAVLVAAIAGKPTTGNQPPGSASGAPGSLANGEAGTTSASPAPDTEKGTGSTTGTGSGSASIAGGEVEASLDSWSPPVPTVEVVR